MEVLDTSAFIHEYHSDADAVSIPLVQEELEDEHAYRFDAMEGAGMEIHLPAEETAFDADFPVDESGRFHIPVNRVQAVKDYIVVAR